MAISRSDGGDTPDYRAFTAGKARAHRLAQAARSQPAPITIVAGSLIWPLVQQDRQVLILRVEDGGTITARILQATPQEGAA